MARAPAVTHYTHPRLPRAGRPPAVLAQFLTEQTPQVSLTVTLPAWRPAYVGAPITPGNSHTIICVSSAQIHNRPGHGGLEAAETTAQMGRGLISSPQPAQPQLLAPGAWH